MLSRSELAAIVGGLAVTVIVLVFVAAWCAWQQETEIRQLRADLDLADEEIGELREWALGVHAVLFGDQPDDGGDDPDPDTPPPGPLPLDVEPDTLRADPWDSWARRTTLLARYSVRGTHRAADGGVPAGDFTDSD